MVCLGKKNDHSPSDLWIVQLSHFSVDDRLARSETWWWAVESACLKMEFVLWCKFGGKSMSRPEGFKPRHPMKYFRPMPEDASPVPEGMVLVTTHGVAIIPRRVEMNLSTNPLDCGWCMGANRWSTVRCCRAAWLGMWRKICRCPIWWLVGTTAFSDKSFSQNSWYSVQRKLE
jgi:hypothetical protein